MDITESRQMRTWWVFPAGLALGLGLFFLLRGTGEREGEPLNVIPRTEIRTAPTLRGRPVPEEPPPPEVEIERPVKTITVIKDSRPVKGARVLVLGETAVESISAIRSFSQADVLTQRETGADGTVSLAGPGVAVWAIDSDRDSSDVTKLGQKGATVQILPRATLSGTVAIVGGGNLEGLRVRAVASLFPIGALPSLPARPANMLEATTGASGRFQLRGLRRTYYRVVVESSDLVPVGEWPVVLPSGEDVVVQVQPVRYISVELVDADGGSPVSSSFVAMSCLAGRGASISQGSTDLRQEFVHTGAEWIRSMTGQGTGRYLGVVRVGADPPKEVPVLMQAIGYERAVSQLRLLRGEEVFSEGLSDRVVLTRVAGLRGRSGSLAVTWHRELPYWRPSRAVVELYRDGQPRMVLRGRWMADTAQIRSVPPGAWGIRVFDGLSRTALHEIRIEPDAEAVLKIADVDEPRPTGFTISVVDHEGLPVLQPDVLVMSKRWSERVDWTLFDDCPVFSKGGVTRRFVRTRAAFDEVTLHVSHPGHAPAIVKVALGEATPHVQVQLIEQD